MTSMRYDDMSSDNQRFKSTLIHINKGARPKIENRYIQIYFLILTLIILISYLFTIKIVSYPTVTIPNETSILIKPKIELVEQKSHPKVHLIDCVVYVEDFGGRLGNRMFIVASAYGLARLHSCHLYITDATLGEIRQTFQPDFSPILISSTKFNSMFRNATQASKISKMVQCDYVLELTRPNAIPKGQFFELTGFWQSYLHFAKYANELRQNIFVGKPSVVEKVSKFFVDLYQKELNITPQFSSYDHHKFKQELSRFSQSVWIGIHVRRRDFIHLGFSSSDKYLLTAVQYFMKRYSNATFIVTSDDKSYCQNLFKNHRNVFITPSSFWEGDDLVILSLCEHTIVTGGTFGWWAGFLVDGEVLHDVKYAPGCEKREQYYPPWFLIDGYVRAHINTNYTI